MVKLTEEMVVARTRMSDFSTIKKLNCWGAELTDVSILRKMRNVEVLSLSVNNINTLADFQFCHSLQDVFIRKNNIKNLNEVCYLQGLPNLRNLWLGENPCAEGKGYRLAVLRALPKLEKLDDKIVSPEEVQTAMTRGQILIHPLNMTTSPPQSDTDITTEYIEEPEIERHRRYSSSSDQRSFEETQHSHEDYHDTDRRNANYNTSPSHNYTQNNQYAYEDYEDRPVAAKYNGEYDERRAYSEYSNNEVSQRTYAPTSPRTQYSGNEPGDDRRIDRSNYEYDDRRQVEYDEPQSQPPLQSRRMTIHHNSEREDGNQVPGWVRHSDKEKCRSQFHYHRRPVTRNSNILSAVLCLVKELDYPSLEVVEMAVRNRMDELEECCFCRRPQNPQGTVVFSHADSMSSIPSPEFSDSLDSTITYSPYINNDGNYNQEHYTFGRPFVDSENPDKRPVRRNGHAENLTMRSPKNVSIDPSPRYFENNQNIYKLRDSVPDNLMTMTSNSEERKGNDVRRVASSDSIPRNSYNGGVILNQGCRVLSQDCVRRSRSPDVRGTLAPLRYIQSAKGTWTYNL